MLLDAKDYDALGVLVPYLLPCAHYGRVQVLSDDGLYTGEVRTRTFAAAQAQGYGVLIEKNGDVWQGPWHDGKMSGTGVLIKKGVRYEGPFVNNQGDGMGKVITRSGISESPWKAGKRHGNEVTNFFDGAKAITSRNMGVVTAYEHTAADGTHYAGDIDAHTQLPHGCGEHTYPNGGSFKGEYRMNLGHSAGELTFGYDHPLFGYCFAGPFINDFWRQDELLSEAPVFMQPSAAPRQKACV